MLRGGVFPIHQAEIPFLDLHYCPAPFPIMLILLVARDISFPVLQILCPTHLEESHGSHLPSERDTDTRPEMRSRETQQPSGKEPKGPPDDFPIAAMLSANIGVPSMPTTRELITR
jgi:hypothetical protein